VLKSKKSITGQYLSGKKSIEVPALRRTPGDQWLAIRGAREHNLKDIDVEIPLGCFVSVTGVSGSGKSSLVGDILYPALMQKIYRSREVPGRHKRIEGAEYLDKVINIDQSPIGRTPRSNPATYTGVFDKIRTLFASTQEAKVRGYQPGRFSFNVKGGRCEACQGDGTIKIEMHFLPDVYVPCEVCKGARYNRDTLDVEWRGKSIADVLDMPCEEALAFFANQPPIARQLQTLVDVGLGYVRLGQPAPTLSGGEAQRVKLSTELGKRATGHTIYILDEPTTGLHFDDVRRLLGVLQRLVENGNTMLVIEHNLDVIKSADWIIDLGPEGGSGGGTIVAEGTPEHVAKVPESYTGRFLAPLLGIDR
jgi:excinuclease ABC subunit A